MKNPILTSLHAASILAVGLLPAAFLPSSAGAANPTYGKPPHPGKYVFNPHEGSGGSLVLRKTSQHGYTVVDFHITLPEECESYAGKVARVTRALHPKRFVAHRTAENEVTCRVSGKKHVRGSGHPPTPNVQVTIGNQAFPARVGLGFSRGLPGFKPGVGGDMELPQVAPECLADFSGRGAGRSG